MKFTFSFAVFFFLFLTIASAQKKEDSFKVIYQQFYNDKYQEGQDFEMIYSDGVTYLSKNEDKIRQYIDYNRKQNVNIINYDGKLYKTTTFFNKLDEGVINKDKTEKIMGYECSCMVYNSFSNKIEVWFTESADAKGSPYKSFIPYEDALVLKVLINGNSSIVANSIKEINKEPLPDYPYGIAEEISEPEFEELKIKSRYTVIPVFENERINFDTKLPGYDLNTASVEKTYRLSNGGVILKKIKLPEAAKNGAYCFAKLTVRSDGDAYDRTGSVFIIPAENEKSTMLDGLFGGTEKLPVYTDKNANKYQGITVTETYSPQTEVMRFFTSFGAGHFNNLRVINNYPWKDDVVYKNEITELIPDNQDEIWIGVFIGNYDKGGHIVNLELDFYPEDEDSDTHKKYIQPLFNTVNILEMSGQNYGRFFRTDTLVTEFEIPENLSDLKLVYTSTGHGGWGNGDEFVPKLNQIFIDGEKIFSFVPWRTDCATYRFSNPASGNFGNGLSSSDLSRSNWCPGTLTPPYFIPLDNLKPGKHKIQVVIDQGEDEGGSFSHWGVSGIITGEYSE